MRRAGREPISLSGCHAAAPLAAYAAQLGKLRSQGFFDGLGCWPLDVGMLPIMLRKASSNCAGRVALERTS
jgi:hypothetical protein